MCALQVPVSVFHGIQASGDITPGEIDGALVP